MSQSIGNMLALALGLACLPITVHAETRCTFTGEQVLAAAEQMGYVASAETEGDGNCEAFGANMVATARETAVTCIFRMLDGVRLVGQWRIAGRGLDGAQFAYVGAAPNGGASLGFAVRLNAPARRTRALTIMTLTFTRSGNGACPASPEALLTLT